MELERYAEKSVRSSWSYWGPIVYGMVKFTAAEWDALPPLYVRKLDMAVQVRNELDKKAAGNNGGATQAQY